MLDKKREIEVNFIKPSEQCIDFIENGEGIFFASEDNFRNGHTILKPETFPLTKWIKQNKKDIKIELDSHGENIQLYSKDYWLPLVFLAQNVTLPLFLSMTYDYLKYKTRGALSGDKNTVKLKIIHKVKNKYQEFNYDGSVEGLKNININKLIK